MVASSKEQEWLLPWWYRNYSWQNDYPVLFVDFGLSKQAQRWCRKRGGLLAFKKFPKTFAASKDRVEKSFLKKIEARFGSFPSQQRHCWFRKPLAMLKTIFEKTLWLDLDCQVKGPLGPLFECLQDRVGCVREPLEVQLERWQNGFQKKGEILYNSGVILYPHGSFLMLKWAEEAVKSAQLFIGDQEMLSRLIFQTAAPILELPAIYNWFFYLGFNPQAQIVHYPSLLGKAAIKEQMKRLANSFFQPDWSLCE
ncbi:MAG: hypothetical protein WC371_05940 [Parachlamydiales bacterium]|jgi:hypothetical protein